ncbi:MAG: hypothetical protein ACTFAK_11280 [Candidatus Electronema sp. VV]
MSEQTSPKDQQQNPNPAPRNPFSGTGITVTGMVRTFSSSQSKEGKLYHDLFLVTGSNAELKISLNSAPDPAKFIVGSTVRIPVMLRSWNKDGRSGMMLVEAS